MSNTYAPCPSCESINRVPIGRSEAEAPICGKCKSLLPVEHGVVEVSGTSLQHLIDRLSLPILTDFWAPWCVPCRAFKIEFQKAAAQMGDQLVFTSLNSMDHAIAADLHGVKTLPTLVIFHHGNEIDRHFGAVSGQALMEWVRGALGQEPLRSAA